MRTLALITCFVAIVGCGDDTGGGGGAGGGGGSSSDTGNTSASGDTTATGSTDANTAAMEHRCTELCECDDFPTTASDCVGTCVASEEQQRAPLAGHPCEAEYHAWANCTALTAECGDASVFTEDQQACQAENEAVSACQDAQQAGSTGSG